MATVGELNILLGGDAAQFEKAIQSGEKNLQNLSRAFVLAGKDAEKFNLGMLNILSKQQGEIGKYSQKLKDDLAIIAQGLKEQGVIATTSEKGVRNLAAAQIVNASQTRAVQEATKQAEKAAKEYEAQLKSLSNSLWLMNNAIRQIGISLTAAFTVPIVGATVAAVKAFTEFERGTVAIQRAAEISRESADNITNSFIKTSQQIPITVNELQRAAFAAGQAGITGEVAIERFALATVKLAKVGGDAFKDLGLDNLADQLAKISIAFGVAENDFENIERVASSLLGVAKDVPGGLGEVIEALRRVSGFASNAGLSLETTTALVGTLVAAAVPASRAGTELGRVISEMNKEVEKLAQVLGYGSEGVDELKKRMDEDLNSVMLETIARLGQVESAQERQRLAFELFGEVGSKAFLPLINNVDLVQALLERANAEFDKGTLLTEEFDIQAQSLGGTFQVFQNNVMALAKALGDDLAPYINLAAKLMIGFLQNALKWWQSLNPTVKTAIVLIGGFLAVLGPLALILNTLFLQPLSGIVTFLTFMGRLTTSAGALFGVLGLTNSQLVLMRGASVAASVGNYSLASSMLTAATASGGFAASLGALLIPLGALLLKVGLVIGALVLLGKIFGVTFKLPSISTPKVGGAGTGGGSKPPPIPGQGEVDTGVSDAEKSAAEAREKALEKELKDRKKVRDKELKILDKNIKEYEKARNSELKILQKAVDDQQDAVDARKELWDDEKENLEDQIDAQKEVLDASKEAVKDAKKILDDIKKANKAKVDSAEGEVDLAEASLKAAQEALKREGILGRDEYDASFRAAEERVKVAESVLENARINLVKLKRIGDQQEQIAEDAVEAAEDQVDVQQEALDALEKALDQRTKIVEDEIEILTDELKIRRKALDDYRDQSGEKLDLLREERDAIKANHDDEIDLIQERLDEVREFNQALKDMPLPTLPDAPEALQAWIDELERQTQEISQQAFSGGTGGLGFDFGGLEIQQGGLLSRMIEEFNKAKELAREEGAGTVRAFFAGLSAAFYTLGQAFWGDLVIDGLFGEGTSEQLEEQARLKGTSIAGVLWDGFKQKVAETWTGLKQLLIDTIFGQGTFEELNAQSNGKGVGLADALWTGLTTKLNELKESVKQKIIEWLPDSVKSILGITTDAGRQQGQALDSGMQQGGSNVNRTGGNLITNFVNGILGQRFNVQNAVSSINSATTALGNMASNAYTWGQNLARSLAEGIANSRSFIEQASNAVGNLISRYFKSFSPPKEGVLKDIDTWGENLTKTFAEGMVGGSTSVMDAVDTIGRTIQDNIGAVELGELAIAPVSGGIGTNITAQADQAAIPALAREAQLADQQANQAAVPAQKNIYIQPGQMIASRGEIRSFVRMLKEYEALEEQR